MKKNMLKYGNFAALILILGISILLFQAVRYDTRLEIAVGVLLSLLYVSWGIIYHSLEGDLHPKVVIEYMVVGCIAVTLIVTVVLL